MKPTNKKTNVQRIAQLEKDLRAVQMTIIGMHNIMKREGFLVKPTDVVESTEN